MKPMGTERLSGRLINAQRLLESIVFVARDARHQGFYLTTQLLLQAETRAKSELSTKLAAGTLGDRDPELAHKLLDGKIDD